MHNKKIRGFNLDSYIREELTAERRRKLMDIIEEDINAGGRYFGAKIGKEFSLNDWRNAVDQVEQFEGGVLLAIK